MVMILWVSGMSLPGAALGAATVGVRAPAHMAVEGGEPGRFRIERGDTGGELRVVLAVSGGADCDKDYAIRGADGVDAASVTVTFRDGEVAAELRVEALDDVHAEADEGITLTLREGEGYRGDPAAQSATVTIRRNDFAVTTTRDGGEGSLRQALQNALDLEGPDTVTFDTTVGPFATKQTIVLAADLPELSGELAIDGSIEGSLWKATGVTVSGGGRRRVFSVAPGARVTLRSLTVADGRARKGGGIANAGTLIVKGVTFVRNVARSEGGALASRGGGVTVINSTFTENRAGRAGGGLADRGGMVTVTNCTFSDNLARTGGGLFSDGSLLVRNTILANSGAASDCVARGAFDPASTHNVIEASAGCGEPISREDPRLAPLGDYNGPVPTMPLGGGSLAINLGDNAAALDEDGGRLHWDQRGNGDPRVVAGFTDIGAFETQAFPSLQVDTFEDREWRACTAAGVGDCSLRGAILLANVSDRSRLITFDPRVFAEPRNILLDSPLPDLATDMSLDASGTAGVMVRAAGRFPVFKIVPGTDVKFLKVVWDEAGSPADPSR
jgi:hypothetical protein